MKIKISLFIALASLIIGLLHLVSTVMLVGKVQYNNSIRAAQNLTDRTDGDIENCLATFYFDIAWHEEPTFKDYWISGWKTLNNQDL